VLTAHCDVIQQHKLHCYLQSVAQWLPRIAAFCDIKGAPTVTPAPLPTQPPAADSPGLTEEERRRRGSSAPKPLTGRPSGSNLTLAAATEGSVQDRAVLRKHTQLVKQIMALLQRNAVLVFSECVKDMRPVMEICEITSGDTTAIVLAQISKFCNKLTMGMEALAGVTNTRCSYDGANNVVNYGAAGEDCDAIFSEPASPTSQSAAGGLGSSEAGSGKIAKGPYVGSDSGGNEPDFLRLLSFRLMCAYLVCIELVQAPLRLLLTALLCNMLTSMMPQLNEELRVLELPNAEGNREFQVRWGKGLTTVVRAYSSTIDSQIGRAHV
jgi:hypothetical protein